MSGSTHLKVTLGRVSLLLSAQSGHPNGELRTEAVRTPAPDPKGGSRHAHQRGGLWGLIPTSWGLWADETGKRGEAAPRLVAERHMFGQTSAEEGAGMWIREAVLGRGLREALCGLLGTRLQSLLRVRQDPLAARYPGPPPQGVGLAGPPAAVVPRVRLLLRLHPPGAAGDLKPLPQGATCCGRRAATPTHSRPGHRAPVSLGDFESVCGNSSARCRTSLSEGALFPTSSLVDWISDF